MARQARSRDGVKIVYEVSGSGTPSLVFVHGWTCDRSHWSDQVRHFGRSHKTVALDLAGHGDSESGRANWTMAEFANDVTAVVSQEKLERVILIGHSMGGIVAIPTVTTLPERVIGIVGADTFSTPRRTREEWLPLLDGLESNFDAAARKFIGGMFVEACDPELRRHITESMLRTPRNVAIGAAHAMAANSPYFEQLRRLRIPKHTINASYKAYDTSAIAAAGVNVLTMSGVGHFVMLEDPPTFNRLLEEAIRSIVGVAR